MYLNHLARPSCFTWFLLLLMVNALQLNVIQICNLEQHHPISSLLPGSMMSPGIKGDTSSSKVGKHTDYNWIKRHLFFILSLANGTKWHQSNTSFKSKVTLNCLQNAFSGFDPLFKTPQSQMAGCSADGATEYLLIYKIKPTSACELIRRLT